MKLSEIISSYRKEHGLSMDAMAQLCQVTKPYISMLENEKNTKTGEPIQPKAVTLVKIAKGMGISIDALVRMMDDDIVVKFESPKYTDEEQQLIAEFRKLNAVGRASAIGVVHAYTLMSEYAKKEKSEATFG